MTKLRRIHKHPKNFPNKQHTKHLCYLIAATLRLLYETEKIIKDLDKNKSNKIFLRYFFKICSLENNIVSL